VRALLLRILALVLPFAVAGAIVAGIDPYRYFPWSASRPIDPGAADIAYRMDPPLWKLADFRHHPAPHLLLGDSRMAELDTTAIDSVTGQRFANLAYGGGSLDEAIKTFWHVDRTVPLRSVTLGINLDSFNQSNSKDRVTGTLRTLANPFLYLCDRLVLRTIGMQVRRRLEGKTPVFGAPPMSRDAFWTYQLDVTARIAYESYRDPEGYRRRLAEMAGHCRRRGIALRFVIFPEHADLQARAARYGLAEARARLGSDLSRIAETVDLSDVIDVRDRARFTDPYHFAPDAEAAIVERLWGPGRGPLGAAAPGGAGRTPAQRVAGGS